MAGELVTGPGLIQWGSLLIGRRQATATITPYRWRTVTGWEETPALDSGNAMRAQQHGGWPGRLLAQTRTVTIEGLMLRAAAGQIGAAVRTLNAACTIAQDEAPLVIWLDDRGPLLVNARLIRRFIPPDLSWQQGYAAGGALQFQATDPRRYALAEQSLSTALPAPESGLAWGTPTETGLDWGSPTETGLAWGTTGSTGDMTVTNSGDAEAHPVIELRGPVTTPTVTTGTGLRLEYDITLAATDTLVIDTWAGTVLLGGQSRIATATIRSAPENAFTLPPGTSTLSFRSAPGSTDPGALATLRWRSAYW
ncbi:phage distal tail protein [Kitasatospora sp. NPDC050543]|uniref:phage distal tail protein n=1 Tax=Kitasatospora sp. NPDC050543 TaxID=3364054 RepID=UPI0037BC149E